MIRILVQAEGLIAFDSTEDLRFHISSRYTSTSTTRSSLTSPSKSTHLPPPPRPNKVTNTFLWIRSIKENRSHHQISMMDGWYLPIKSGKSAIIRISWCSDMVIIPIWNMFWELQRVSGVQLQPPWVLCVQIITIHCIFIPIHYQNNRSMTICIIIKSNTVSTFYSCLESSCNLHVFLSTMCSNYPVDDHCNYT